MSQVNALYMTKKPTSLLQRHHERVKQLPKHPFIVPIITFFGLFIISAVLFVVAGGRTVRPDDSHIVRLYVDGKSQTVPSRASNVGELLTRLKVELGEYDVVEPALDAAITDDNFNVNVYRAHPVTIVDDTPEGPKTSKVTYSAQQAPDAIAKQAGIAVYPEDKVELAPSNDILKTDGVISQKVVIARAIPTSINLYGNQISFRTQAKTVGQALKEKGVSPVEGDTVVPTADTPMTPNTQIFVVRMGKQIATVEEAIPAATQTENDPAVPAGTTVVKQEGSAGKKLATYEIELQNGKEASRKLLQEVVSVEPVPRIVAKGTKVVNTRIAGDKSAILAAAGVPASQHFAADFIIARESGWNLAARNASGCLGLGQACPGSKLVAVCPNWSSDAVCQIQFFSGYANGRYGSWQAAYEAWQIKHWW